MLLKVVLPDLSTGITWKVGHRNPQSLTQISVSQKLLGHKTLNTQTHMHRHMRERQK